VGRLQSRTTLGSKITRKRPSFYFIFEGQREREDLDIERGASEGVMGRGSSLPRSGAVCPRNAVYLGLHANPVDCLRCI
jgi:hypothetical protein